MTNISPVIFTAAAALTSSNENSKKIGFFLITAWISTYTRRDKSKTNILSVVLKWAYWILPAAHAKSRHAYIPTFLLKISFPIRKIMLMLNELASALISLLVVKKENGEISENNLYTYSKKDP